jgi:hypothetical protein
LLGAWVDQIESVTWSEGDFGVVKCLRLVHSRAKVDAALLDPVQRAQRVRVDRYINVFELKLTSIMDATADCIGSQCENKSIDDNGDKTHEFDDIEPNANATFSLSGWTWLTMQNRKRIQTNFNHIIEPAENGSRGKGSGKKHDVPELNDDLVEVTKGIVRVISRQDIRPSKLLVALRYFSLVFELLY